MTRPVPHAKTEASMRRGSQRHRGRLSPVQIKLSMGVPVFYDVHNDESYEIVSNAWICEGICSLATMRRLEVSSLTRYHNISTRLPLITIKTWAQLGTMSLLVCFVAVPLLLFRPARCQGENGVYANCNVVQSAEEFSGNIRCSSCKRLQTLAFDGPTHMYTQSHMARLSPK